MLQKIRDRLKPKDIKIKLSFYPNMGKGLPKFLKHLPVFDHSDFYDDGRRNPPSGSPYVVEIANVVHLPKADVVDYSRGKSVETLEDAVRTYSVSGIIILPDGKFLKCSKDGYLPSNNTFIGEPQYIPVRNIRKYITLLKL